MLVATWISPKAGAVAAVLLVVGALAVLLTTRAWRQWRSVIGPVTVTLGAFLFAIGLAFLWSSQVDPYSEVEKRFYDWQLPGDDRLPGLLASWIASPGDGEFLDGDWLPSDRPPLQAGFILLFRIAGAPVATLVQADSAVVDYAASVAAQMLWVPAVLAVVRAVGHIPRVALFATAFAALVPVVVVNTVFPWPKTLAGALAVAAAAALVSGLRGKARPSVAIVLAALLATGGVLSHGGAALMLPLILPLALTLLWRVRGASRWLLAGGAALAVVVAYLPWLLYQRFLYPPGDRLLKWHFAGVIPIDDRPFLQALVDQYGAASFGDLIDARISNLGRALNPFLLFAGVDASPGWRADRAHHEFFDTPAALGISFVIALAVLIAWMVLHSRRRHVDAPLPWSGLLVAGAFGCIVVWAVAMYLPESAVVHQGSQAWMLMLIAIPFAWLVSRKPWIGGAAALAQFAWTLTIYATPPELTDPTLRVSVLIVGLLGLVLLAVAPIVDAALGRQPNTERSAPASASL